MKLILNDLKKTRLKEELPVGRGTQRSVGEERNLNGTL